MPRKFVLGLGVVAPLPATAQDTTVSISTGSFVNPLVGNQQLATIVKQNGIAPDLSYSQPSAPSFHSTLFEDFDLVATPVYNFYTADELSPTASIDPSAKLRDVPRYVILSWRPAPAGTFPAVSNKGTRRPDARVGNLVPLPIAFDTARSSVVNGYVGPGAIRANVAHPLPAVTKGGTTSDDGFLLGAPTALDVAAAYTVTGSIVHVASVARVNFVDPSIAGALDQNRISVTKDHVHAASIASLAKIAGALEVISEFNQDAPVRNPPPVFPVDPSTPTGRYVGYVLERHELHPDGTMVLSRTFPFSDANTVSYIDRDVHYLGSYAYRIRAIFQWSHPPNVGFSGRSTVDLVPASGSVGSSFSSLAVSSFYSGGWSDWSRAVVQDTIPPDPPDELTALPGSAAGRIRVSWKMPRDPRRDISTVRIYRRTRGTEWILLGNFPVTNGALNDHVLPDTPYIYAAVSVTYHGTVSTFSEQVEAQLSTNTGRGEKKSRQFSEQGASFGGYTPIKGFKIPRELLVQRSVTFFCRPAPSDSSLVLKSYTVELRSLSTGERLPVALSADSIIVVPSVPKISGGRA